VRVRFCSRILIALAAVFAVVPPAFAQIEIKENDRIAVIGNALADRMQQDGWLEAYLQSANPGKRLVIRDLGFSGDQVAARPREESCPALETYLSIVKTNVIFAFFGYNESFSHDPDSFKKELASFLTFTRIMHFDGKSGPQIVLFSPIAHEDLGTPNFPDGKENNLWLSIYTDAMARVAHDKQIPFVDLFAASNALYEKNDAPLTINGVHLNAEGNRQIARVIMEALGQKYVETNVDAIRAAVVDKNWCWFNRYRATDGNDVWGSRSILRFVDDQTNADVLQHELVMLDRMAENRDEVIWKAVEGENVKPDDSNVPRPLLVKTNYSPSEKNGALSYVPASEGVNTLKLAKGMVANLFASEEMFPELVNPVQMDVDTKGRIWVAAWETYPKWQPDREMLDRLLILPDDNRDGIADKAITFAFVHNPTGFTFWNGGVIVASVPNILFLKDTDGDDVADVHEVIFSGLDSADTHHSANGFDYGPDGYIYYQRGIFNVSNVETPWQAAQLHYSRTGMYRFNPRTHRFSFHADNSPNPHGGDFDYWGYHFATDATSGRAFQVLMDTDGRFKMNEMLEKTVRPVPSSGILSSMHFPDKNNGNYIILNAIGFLGIKQYTLENNDGIIHGTETEDLLVSNDTNFRPSDFKIGDDGALYVADWSNTLIGHMQHNIRDPARDHNHGRVYRITVEGRALQDHVEIDGQPIDALLDVLKHPTDGVRLRARIELSERDTNEVVAAVTKWIAQFDGTKKDDAHHLLEALWLCEQHNVVNEGLLTVLLNSPEPNARRAAERVKYMWNIEGKLRPEAKGMLDHMTHMKHESEKPYDYFAQEKSPEPAMEGDTMVVHIQTLKEQMRYDRRAFAVAPGMKVRVVFSNPDAMDHNMVFVLPGASTEVAMAAMMLGADGIKKNWLPESGKIFAASKMLSMGKKETIEFVAPATLGAYDYVCTYPGHFMLMNGVMYVVEDVQKWIADNKDAPAQPERKFVRDWKIADLADDLEMLQRDRSLDKGEAVFKSASCAVCHVPSLSGGRIGPDLAGVSERFQPDAMLTEIFDPSKVINEKFKSWELEIETDDTFAENVLRGLIVEEGDDYVRVVTNPLQDTVGTKVAKAKIKDKKAAPLSTMPTGLLNSFTEDEILDLMAYLRSVPAPKTN
jgi:putative heme-binding domain-containing protein